MKQTIALLACLLTGGMLQAQAVPMALEDWKTTQGTQNFFYKNVTKTDASGNVYVAGATMNNGFPDMLVAKYNAAGNLQWIRQMAGTAPNGVDAIAGMYVTGTDVYVTGAVSNNSVTPETDCITMKLSGSTGSVLWSATYTGAAGGHDAGKDVTLDGSGNVYVSGASYNSSFNTDYLVLKYNSSGVQQWASGWDYTGADDGAYKIALSGTNVNVTGAVTTTTPGTYRMSTIKLAQASGSITAANTSTAVTTSSVEAVTDMALDGSGNVILVGSQYTGGQHDFYVQKLNASTLSSVFVYTWDSGSSLDDYAKAVTTDASGNVFVAGFSSTSSLGRELTLIKLNSSGTHQWTQTSGFGGDDEAADLVTDASGDVYVTGFKTNSTKDYYTAKYSTAGTKIWEIEADGNGGLDDNATNMALDSLNHVIVTGQSKTGSGDYEFMTLRYAQKEVTTPTDFDGESPAPNFMYYRNSGQIIAADTVITQVPEVKFYTNNTYPSFYFGNRKQSFVFARMDTSSVSPSDTLHRIDLDFTASNESAETYPMNEQENGYLNYFLAHTGSNGIANVKGNQRLITPELYHNIDLMCSSNQNGIKYYFIVKPGGDMRDIQMEFTGASSFNLNGTTNELTINSSIGSMTFDKPIVYQLTSGNVIVPVTAWTADWQSNGASNKYKFNDGAYNTAQTLIIEVDQGNTALSITTNSLNCTWSTYVGGMNFDTPTEMKTDHSSNLFVSGRTTSSDYPLVSGANVYQNFNAGSANGFMDKYSNQGERLWSTYVGGTADDIVLSFDFAPNGDVYILGQASSVLVTQAKAGASNSLTPLGAEDFFILQVSSSSQQKKWLTYYGGNAEEVTAKCKFDVDGNFFIVGRTISKNLPIVGSSPQYTNTTHDVAATSEGFIVKFNTSSQIVWATYLGSSINGTLTSAYDGLLDLDFGSNKDLYVVGYANGTDYPSMNNGSSTNFSHFNDVVSDATISQFSNSGQMKWSTCMGGSKNNAFSAIKIKNDKIYVAGYNVSNGSYPYINSNNWYFHGSYTGGSTNAIFAIFDDQSILLHYSTFTEIGYQTGNDIEVDNTEVIYISGETNATSFPSPLTQPANTFIESNNGLENMFIYAIAPGNSDLVWATQIGGNGSDGVIYTPGSTPITIDQNNILHITGATQSTSLFPLYSGTTGVTYFDNTFNSGIDIGITRFNLYPINFYDGINENAKDLGDFFVYPNPAQHIINVRLNNPKKQTFYYIYNNIGQVIRQGSFIEQQETNSIELSSLTNGFYILEIIQQEQKASVKFIKHD